MHKSTCQKLCVYTYSHAHKYILTLLPLYKVNIPLGPSIKLNLISLKYLDPKHAQNIDTNMTGQVGSIYTLTSTKFG